MKHSCRAGRNTMYRHFRERFFSSTAALALVVVAGMGSVAVAQEGGAAEDGIEMIVVTGSRIPRADLQGSSPIAVVDGEEFDLAGTVNVEELLNALPQVNPSFGSSTNNPGQGEASVDLRGLGRQRTLVLVNGRRFTPLISVRGGAVSVDVNNIPSGLVDRVEVVTGGASAVYGSDAIAGVVNFILKDNFEGLEIGAQYKISAEGDVPTYNIDALFGVNLADGRGNVTVYAEYYQQDEGLLSSRAFPFFFCRDGNELPGSRGGAPCGLGGSTANGATFGLTQAGSGSIPRGRLNLANGFDLPGGNVSQVQFNQDGSLAEFVSPNDQYNFAPQNFLQLPLERLALSGTAHYQITDNVRAYVETNFVNVQSDTQLAETPVAGTFSITLDGNPFLTPEALTILKDAISRDAGVGNDGLTPIGTMGSTSALFSTGRRMVEIGLRENDNDRTTYRIVAGLDGLFSNDWTWDTYFQYGRHMNTNTQQGTIAPSRYQQALLIESDGAGGVRCTNQANGCVPINIFGAGNISPEAAAFIAINPSNIIGYEQTVAAVSVAGELMDMPAGALGFAAGIEYRKEEVNFRPDFFSGTGDVRGFNTSEAIEGSYDVFEIYAEALVPVTSSINIEAGYRYSDYSTVGGVSTYKFGGDWSIFDGLRLRAMVQQAVRAPSVGELFQGFSRTSPQVTDPCSADQNPTGVVADLCVLQGVPLAQIGIFTQNNSQIGTRRGGNPDLTEEESSTWSVGAVIQPSAIEGLSLTLDYYSIEIEDAIGPRGGGGNGIVSLCFSQTTDLNNISDMCQYFDRDVSGNINTFPGINAQNANAQLFQVEGIDLQVDYTFDAFSGTFDFMWLGTHTFTNEITGPDGSTFECAGFIGSGCGQTVDGGGVPDDSFVTRLSYNRGGKAGYSLRWRWIGDLQNTNPGGAVQTSDAESYVDLSMTYDLNDSLRFFGGIENIFDNNSPTAMGNASAAIGGNTDVSIYDIIGTRIFIGAKMMFH